jgi:hypothetical protein
VGRLAVANAVIHAFDTKRQMFPLILEIGKIKELDFRFRVRVKTVKTDKMAQKSVESKEIKFLCRSQGKFRKKRGQKRPKTCYREKSGNFKKTYQTHGTR